jgi:hypothetical protein
MGASRRSTLLGAMALPAFFLGCGNPDGGPPDRGDVPDGHVRFELSFKRGPSAPSPESPGGPQSLYLQENDVQWRDPTGVMRATTYRDWLAIIDPVQGGFGTDGHLCRCDQCGVCRNPTEEDGTLVTSPQVGELRDGETARYEWDGTIWTRESCPDGSDCIRALNATPGRYAIEFTWGLNFSHHIDWLYSIISPPLGSSGAIYFDYPEAGVVSYTVDCSRSSNIAEPVEPCI